MPALWQVQFGKPTFFCLFWIFYGMAVFYFLSGLQVLSGVECVGLQRRIFGRFKEIKRFGIKKGLTNIHT
jgi:hypothetical protein